MVNDGNWHRLEIVMVKQNLTMRIDDGERRKIVNDGAIEFLSVASPLFIGGLPKDAASNAMSQWHVQDTQSFQGRSLGLAY